MTIIWCMVPEISSTTNRISSHFGLFFALLPLLTIQKIKILKKWKKTPGRYYHFPHEHHKSKLYMIPEIWSKTDIIFSLPFYPSPPVPPTKQPKQSKFWKMKKNPRDIILHKCTINDNHMMYGSWDINCNRQIFFVILGHFLPFYPTNSPKIKYQKNKKCLEISSFYRSVPKIINHRLLFLRYGMWQM